MTPRELRLLAVTQPINSLSQMANAAWMRSAESALRSCADELEKFQEFVDSLPHNKRTLGTDSVEVTPLTPRSEAKEPTPPSLTENVASLAKRVYVLEEAVKPLKRHLSILLDSLA
jgi:hypothetical protein